MTPQTLTVRCMAWQESGVWVAVCLDFALAVQGDSPQDVRAKLHEQIADYVDEALTIDAAHAEELLARRAPLRDRLRYAAWKVASQWPALNRLLEAIKQRRRQRQPYIEPLPLRAA